MDYNKALEKARQMAEKAKPGIMKHDGKIYTFEFCQKEWVYRIYEDGFLFLRVNTKMLSGAKKFLKNYLEN